MICTQLRVRLPAVTVFASGVRWLGQIREAGGCGGSLACVSPPGPAELQALWEACDRRARRDAVLLRVQQRPAVSALWQPGLPFCEAIFLLQSSGSLLMKALLW